MYIWLSTDLPPTALLKSRGRRFLLKGAFRARCRGKRLLRVTSLGPMFLRYLNLATVRMMPLISEVSWRRFNYATGDLKRALNSFHLLWKTKRLATFTTGNLSGFCWGYTGVQSCSQRVAILVSTLENRFSFGSYLKGFSDVFATSHQGVIMLNPELKTSEERTKALGNVIRFLGKNNLIPGIRNEMFPVKSSYGSSVFFSLERAAAPYFGIKAYGIHMNGYVEKGDQKFLWIGKRSPTKSTFPGMLDHLVAGGLPHGIDCGENVIKECEEEAGIPRSISKKAIPVGAISYADIDGYRYKRDVLFCYDLKLPEDFVPSNQDGEVESFKMIPVEQVANIIRRTQFFKSNCSLVITDFLFRHGFIRPESFGYLDLLQSLRSGDCS